MISSKVVIKQLQRLLKKFSCWNRFIALILRKPKQQLQFPFFIEDSKTLKVAKMLSLLLEKKNFLHMSLNNFEHVI